MLGRLVLALVVFVVVGLALVYLLGPVLLSVGIPFLFIFGEFFVRWGWVLGLAAGAWQFFSGGGLTWPFRR